MTAHTHTLPPGHDEHGECDHRAQNAVRVGDYLVYPGGIGYFQSGDLKPGMVLVPLTSDRTPVVREFDGEVIPCHLPDFGGVSADWEQRLRGEIIPRLRSLKEGEKMVPFCFASRGRTGTFLASLIAILEPDTKDPIAAVRERHCHHAVETLAQAEGIFALRGEKVPAKYRKGPQAFHR
jgi:hypothetical protein